MHRTDTCSRYWSVYAGRTDKTEQSLCMIGGPATEIPAARADVAGAVYDILMCATKCTDERMKLTNPQERRHPLVIIRAFTVKSHSPLREPLQAFPLASALACRGR